MADKDKNKKDDKKPDPPGLLFVFSQYVLEFFFYFFATEGLLFGLSPALSLPPSFPFAPNFTVAFCLNLVYSGIWGASHSASAQPFLQARAQKALPWLFKNPTHVFMICSGVTILPFFFLWNVPLGSLPPYADPSSPPSSSLAFSQVLDQDVMYDIGAGLVPQFMHRTLAETLPFSFLDQLLSLIPALTLYQLSIQAWNVFMFKFCMGRIAVVMTRIAQAKVIQSAKYGHLSNPNAKPQLLTDGEYGWVRHPLYMYLMLMMWATPRMTYTRFSVIAGWILYLIPGVAIEEKRLEGEFGAGVYEEYRRKVPARFIPFVY